VQGALEVKELEKKTSGEPEEITSLKFQRLT